MRKVLTLVLVLLGTVGLLAACGGGTAATPTPTAEIPQAQPGQIVNLTPQEAYQFLQAHPEAVFLDVRTPREYQAGHAPGTVLIPVDELANRLEEVPRDRPIVVICRSGNRSLRAAQILVDAGYPQVYNVTLGLIGWSQAGLPITTQ